MADAAIIVLAVAMVVRGLALLFVPKAPAPAELRPVEWLDES